MKLFSLVYFFVLLGFTPVHASTDICSACDDPTSPYYCSQVTEPWHFGESPFKELHRLFQAPESDLISATELRGLFKVDNDPCYRSDTIIKNNFLSNSGRACTIKFTYPTPFSNNSTIELTIPPDLSVALVKSEKAVHFTTIGWPIISRIKTSNLKGAYFANINQLILTQEYARIPLKSGCIQYNFR